MSLQPLRTRLSVPRALYTEAIDPNGTVRAIAESVKPGIVPIEGRVLHFADFTPDVPMNHVLQGDHSPEQQGGHTVLGTRAWAMVPPVFDERPAMAFTVHASEVRHWTPEDITAIF